MLEHGGAHTVPKGNEVELNPFPPCELHGRNEITVARYQHKNLYVPLESECCNIEPEAHVHTLLMDIGLEIGGCERNARFLLGKSALPNFPPAKRQISSTNGYVRDSTQPCQQIRVRSCEWSRSEIYLPAEEWLCNPGLERRRVVPVHPMEGQTRDRFMSAQCR